MNFEVCLSRGSVSMPRKILSAPTREFEIDLLNTGFDYLIGVDEAGRGCLAGPVAAAAVLYSRTQNIPSGINDSKKLSSARRESLLTEIQATALGYGIGFSTCSEIDRWNILEATALANLRAVEALLGDLYKKAMALTGQKVCFLFDGNLPFLPKMRRYLAENEMSADFPFARRLFSEALSEKSFVKGDSLSLSIASASILAKVSRDRYMTKLEASLPGYAFAVHKGYFTALHREKLLALGASAEHRQSFAPVRDLAQLSF